MLYRILLLIILLSLPMTAEATREDRIAHEKLNVLMAHLALRAHTPMMEMRERFGNNIMIGGGFMFKSNTNWLFTMEYNFLYGPEVKEDVLQNIRTSLGDPINRAGNLEDISLQQRGHMPALKVGKVFPIIGPNENSGIFFQLGGVFMQHQVYMFYSGPRRFPQIDDEYGKGYDRLSRGFGTSQTIGYIHFSNQNLFNFYIGFDFVQAFTYNQRAYNFDEMRAEDELRRDLLTGVKGGVFFPFFSRFWEKRRN